MKKYLYLITYRDTKKKYFNMIVKAPSNRRAKLYGFMEYNKYLAKKSRKSIRIPVFDKFSKITKVKFSNVFKLYKVPLKIRITLLFKLIFRI